jgi:hypothetical protein
VVGSYAASMRWLRRHRALWIWIGGGITVVAILIAFSSTVYRGRSTRDFPPPGGDPNAVTDNSGKGSDNMLALGSFCVAVVAAGGTVLVARVTRRPASVVDRVSRPL